MITRDDWFSTQLIIQLVASKTTKSGCIWLVSDFISTLFLQQTLLLLSRFTKNKATKTLMCDTAARIFLRSFIFLWNLYLKIIFIVDNSKPIMVKVQQEKRGGERRAPRVAKKMQSHKFSGNGNSHAPNKVLRSLINHFNIGAYTAAREHSTMIDTEIMSTLGTWTSTLWSILCKNIKKF